MRFDTMKFKTRKFKTRKFDALKFDALKFKPREFTEHPKSPFVAWHVKNVAASFLFATGQ